MRRESLRAASTASIRLCPTLIGWLALLRLGVRTVQLRLKNADETEARRQIRESLRLARAHGFQLIVNDYWQPAIEEGADFVHLGQEDLAAADVKSIKRHSLRLGVSTHDEAELETALAADPDYIALGPIYETKLKVMKWAPQGLQRVGAWKKRIGNVPLVAIGGITPDLADGVVAAGAEFNRCHHRFLYASRPRRPRPDVGGLGPCEGLIFQYDQGHIARTLIVTDNCDCCFAPQFS